jgi:hypothetical protein
MEWLKKAGFIRYTIARFPPWENTGKNLPGQAFKWQFPQ